MCYTKWGETFPNNEDILDLLLPLHLPTAPIPTTTRTNWALFLFLYLQTKIPLDFGSHIILPELTLNQNFSSLFTLATANPYSLSHLPQHVHTRYLHLIISNLEISVSKFPGMHCKSWLVLSECLSYLRSSITVQIHLVRFVPFLSLFWSLWILILSPLHLRSFPDSCHHKLHPCAL